MKKKIILIITLIFHLTINSSLVEAKSILINNISREVEIGETLITDQYEYDPSSNTIILKDANLRMIKTDDDLHVILKGNNNFDSKNEIAISGKTVTISGDGTLNIVGNQRGIFGRKVIVNDTNISINTKDVCIFSHGELEWNDLIINNSKLTLESYKSIFQTGIGNVYLNNSNILINRATNISTNNIYLNNTNLKVYNINQVLPYNTNHFYINGNSNIFIESKNNNFLNENYLLGNNLKIQASNDNINYYDIKPEEHDKYIKIYPSISYEDLVSKEKDLNTLKDLLENTKLNLIEKEKELKLLNDRLILKEEELIKKEEMVLNIENILKTKENQLNDLETDLTSIKDNLDLKDNNLKTKEKELLNKKNDLDEKELYLKKFEIDLNTKKQELLNFKINLDNKEKELEKRKGDLDDAYNNNCQNIEESINNIENPKTFDSFINSCILMIISLIVFVIIILIKRKDKYVRYI